MKTHSKIYHITLLRNILNNNTKKYVDYDSVTFDGEKVRFKTYSKFDCGISKDYLVVGILLTILIALLPMLGIMVCPNLTALFIWSLIDIFGIYLTNTLLLGHKPEFAILCTFLSLACIFWLFTGRIEFMLENGQPCNIPLKLREFFETIPSWIYKF